MLCHFLKISRLLKLSHSLHRYLTLTFLDTDIRGIDEICDSCRTRYLSSENVSNGDDKYRTVKEKLQKKNKITVLLLNEFV